MTSTSALPRKTPGPLAGVPFAVKNLFDIKGLPTRAGSKINRDDPPAERNSVLAQRLENSGAVLVGGLNMGEYAYDFTGENIHDGASRNPHDLAHMSGGSSGGSGSAVAAGLVPFSLGSDTNGSIRVPSAFCGLFGLKPTYGRLPRSGSFPFVTSFDHLGPLGISVADLAATYDAMQGFDAGDPASVRRPAEPVSSAIDQGIDGLRIAVAGGYFSRGGDAEAFAAVRHCAKALDATRDIEIPEAQRARAAAYLITASEGAALHLDRLRSRAGDFDPAVRDRLIAGAMIPAVWVNKAQRFRRWYHGRVVKLFEEVDVILAPSTPCRAPRIGQTTFRARRRGDAGASEYRHLYPADFLYRPACRCSAGLAGCRPAARRAGDRGTVARGHRAARCAVSGDEGHRSHPRGRPLMQEDQINIPAVKAEVEAVFAKYETALVTNDVAALENLFWDDARVIRYGGGENLYGMDEIRFRQARSPVGLERTLSRTVITTFGTDMATASTLFHRTSAPGKVGRQMQTWMRFPDGWKVVAAHVSLINDPG